MRQGIICLVLFCYIKFSMLIFVLDTICLVLFCCIKFSMLIFVLDTSK